MPHGSGPRGYQEDRSQVGSHSREVTCRSQALRKGWSMHCITTPQGRRWLLVRIYVEGDERPFEEVEQIRNGELIFSLDALEDTIREL